MEYGLYTDLARYYTAVSADRDFAAQVDFMSQCAHAMGHPLVPGAGVLELFAGPAWHTQVLRERFTAASYCIDASDEMRNIAIASGRATQETYIVGVVPDALEQLPPQIRADLVLMLRYSIGYLDPAPLAHLCRRVQEVMQPGGLVFVELHNLGVLRNGLQALTIRDRVVTTERGETVRCVWPTGDITWDDDDWSVTMAVRFDITDSHGATRVLTSTSREHIYPVKTIERLATACGLAFLDVTPQAQHAFPDSRVVVLQRSHV